ncbi:MAG: homoserine dehydrogenase, partial [Myxococcales bacterium]|nr:homoserine dehydrogenase [Myxococcales bacterium]
MTRPIRIGLLGAGVVGEGILRLLEDNATSIERRMGTSIEVRKVVARNPDKARGGLLEGLLSFDPNDVLDDPEIDVVVEVMGGLDPAGDYVRRAIEAGKSVVTANKALLAERGHALIELSEAKGVDLYFEAAVAGGIPVIRVLREALAADRVVALRGIVNGTSNYILSEMTARGVDFAEALGDAQKAGYAEADPTLDVGGGDATHKLAILATLAFGAEIRPEEISTEGIADVGAVDIEMARRFGYVLKPLAVGAELEDGALDLRVHPALVPE